MPTVPRAIVLLNVLYLFLWLGIRNSNIVLWKLYVPDSLAYSQTDCISFVVVVVVNLDSMKGIPLFLIRSLFNHISLQILQIPVMLSYWKEEEWYRIKKVLWNLKEYG